VDFSPNLLIKTVFLIFCLKIPTAKLALILCVALDKKFEELFYLE